MSLSPSNSESVVLVSPTAKDAHVTSELFARSGINCIACAEPVHLPEMLESGVGALLITDIALAGTASTAMVDALRMQPAWSNIPVIALCRDGLQSPPLIRALGQLTNVTVLDRPTSTRSLRSAVQAALRGRRWQYQIRDQLSDLLEAEASLRLSDQRKDEFLATLAHELRNPLAPIRTGLFVLRSSADNPQTVARLQDMMERQLTQLVRLIDDLLDISRISTGKVELQFHDVDMRDVVRDGMEVCQSLAARKNIEMAVSLPEAPIFVRGDGTRLSQLVGNLLNNAAKYTPYGGRISLRLTASQDQMTMEIADTGIGIPESMLESIFEMFTQVKQNQESVQGGLGIGLALVKHLVELHGGDVAAGSSGSGRGSIFTVHLPLSRTAGSLVRPRPSENNENDENDLRQGHMEVMIVDDNEDAAESLAMMLTLSGHHARVYHSGDAALRALKGFQPHIIFCDIAMPGMGGYELASRVRREPLLAGTKLVAVTGWGTEQDKLRSRRAGFDFHLTKPASASSVRAILVQVRPPA